MMQIIGRDAESRLQAKGFIFSDIEREIQLARADKRQLQALGVTPGGGNFLAALGLLCYTEFGGKLKFRKKTAAQNFNGFFDFIGPDYKGFRGSFSRQNEVYDVFRCGLAHEYYVKKSCVIAMLACGSGLGIGRDSSGRFVFIVESYCRDLKQAFDRLEGELYGKP
jgi:hypothetical protein